jgi:uncharacterized membrane protein required for colicin V production
MEMTSFDILLLLLVITGGTWGWVTGATRVIAPFTLLFALTVLIHTYPDLSARLGKTPLTQFFVILLLCLIGILICGLVGRALYTAVHNVGLGHVDKLFGLALGLITGCVMAGLLVWWLKAHVGSEANTLLKGSFLAASFLDFFEMSMSLAEHILPQAKPKEPWWKRPLW